MSDPQFAVLPGKGQNGQPIHSKGAVNVSDNDLLQEQMAQIAQTILRNNEAAKQKEDQESEWESVGRTLTSLTTVLSLIISTRYFSPVQWILKISCIVLGVTSLFELIGRVATKDGIIARVRPQPYYRPSKHTYSRLFSELGEAIDMTSVKLQEIVFAENLQNTGIAFVLSFIAYWLVKVISPFWLAIIATLLTYTLGPIFTRQSSKANLSNVKSVIGQKAQDLKDGAVNTASSAANHATNTAQNLSSQAVDTASSATAHVAGKAQDLKDGVVDTASSATNHATTTAQNLGSQVRDTTSSATDRVAGKVQDLKDGAVDTASSATNRATNTAQNLGSQVRDTTSSATDRVAGSMQNLKDGAVDTASSATNRATNTAQNLGSQARHTTSSATGQVAETAQNLKNNATTTASPAIDHTATVRQNNTSRTTGTAANINDHSQSLKHRSVDTAYATADGKGAVDYGAGGNYAGDYRVAPPNAPGFDQNGLSKDRRAQFHPLESKSVNVAL